MTIRIFINFVGERRSLTSHRHFVTNGFYAPSYKKKQTKMGQCSQCGSSVPDGQNICSMCMGDINHGSDGYYQQWAEEQMAKEQADQAAQADQARYEAEQNAQGQADADAAQYGCRW